MTAETGIATIKNQPPRGGSWSPVEGPEVGDLLDRTFPTDPGARRSLAEASRAILARCAEPAPSTRSASEAGLAVGYVQSGKTLSFTTVAALAKDNGYAMVILIGGTSLYLLGQTEGRLTNDLALEEKRTWLHVRGPRSGISEAQRNADVQTIQSTLDEWEDDDFDADECRTVIVTVMKHAGNLSTLAKMIERLRIPSAPVLIIDDEADQASLDGNAGSPKKPTVTKTYAAISELRDAVRLGGANHTFLQYTATPQANLLIEISDTLSPSFVQVLEPGEAYIGGRELFLEKEDAHIRRIPTGEVDRALETQEGPPNSLRDALASFLVGIAADYSSGLAKQPKANRSMLVHPSRLTGDHSRLREWMERMKSDWSDLLHDNAELSAPEERGALFEILGKAHKDLARTDASLPTLAELAPFLRRALIRTEILELNKGAPPVPWSRHFSFILIGGQAIERGFTVEGLTTTHLARSLGQKLADSIQQRARFFGYKRGYLGRVRIWIDDDTRAVFKEYAKHEQDLRSRLKPIAEAGRPLRDWRREFLLDPGLKATRRNVLARGVKQRQLSDDWLTLDRPALTGPDLEENRRLVEHLKSSLEMDEDDGHSERTLEQRHLISSPIPVSELLGILADARVADLDQRDLLYGAMLQLDAFSGEPGRTGRVVLMGKSSPRVRTIANGKIAQLYQGRNPRSGVPTYPGDREIMVRDEPTLQIHMLQSKDGTLLRIPAFALWVPQKFKVGTLVQSNL
tara:strand:- start:2362 stop:4593 length:2232 start_codon:yes stop_codon:yes gene_type:complete